VIQNYLHDEAKSLCVKGEDVYNFWDEPRQRSQTLSAVAMCLQC